MNRAIAVYQTLVARSGGAAMSPYTLDLVELLLLSNQHDSTSDSALVGDAVALAHQVLRVQRWGTRQDAQARVSFAMAMVRLAGSGTDSEIVDLAEECYLVLLADASPDDDIGGMWHTLALVRHLRHKRTGQGSAEAIEAARRAVVAGARGDQALEEAQVQTLALMFLHGDRLDDALTLSREGIAATGGRGSARSRSVLARILLARFEHSERLEELDECIALLRDIDMDSLPPAERRRTANGLGNALLLRYGASPDLDTLHESVRIGRRQLEDLPPGDPNRPVLLHNLSVRLMRRYHRNRDLADADAAAAFALAALDATPHGDPRRASRTATLTALLTVRFQHTGDQAALEEAVGLIQHAVDISTPDAPDHARRLVLLAASLMLLAERTGNQAMCAAAVRVGAAALEATPADHPMLVSRMYMHCGALVMCGGHSDLPAALEVAEAAAQLPGSSPPSLLPVQHLLGRIAAELGDWARATEALSTAVHLLPMLAPRNLRRRDAEHQLTEIQDVHLDAAAAALNAQDPQRALVLLEQGRGVLLSYALDARTELTDLRGAHPGLADEFEDVVEALDRVHAQADEAGGNDQRYQLLAAWEEVVDRIRATPGFHGFARPPALEELLRAGAHGPVVTVVVSVLGCSALVVTPTGLQVVPLPDLTANEAIRRSQAYLDAVDRLTDGDGEGDGRNDAGRVLDATLVWLWDVIAQPVLEALGHRRPPRAGAAWPRLWWSPTGPLALLPLHAAGRHNRRGRSVIDRVVSSYTPTLRSLLHARDRDSRPAPGRLVVAVTRAPGAAPLPGASTEARNVAPDDSDTVRLIDADATVSAVTEALLRAGRAHFACHAVTDPASPSETHLLLADGALPVREISRLRLPHVELAYLSACSTARGDARLADEAIHVSSAFQLAGYRHVVGTLWPVLDTITGRMTRNFYARLAAGDPPAEALHAVIRKTRSDHLHAPFVWAAHVHAGP